MAIQTKRKVRFIDKEWLRQKHAEMDARTGFVYQPGVNPQQVRAMMLAEGIRPEDNEFSREIIRMRYEEE